MHAHDSFWNSQRRWFRDDEQRSDVQHLISVRLADDRAQTECRFLMRFHEHLGYGYEAVTHNELVANVSAWKMALIDELLELAWQRDFSAIDSWVNYCMLAHPAIVDKGVRRALRYTLCDYWLEPPRVESMPTHAANWIIQGFDHPAMVECATMYPTDHPHDIRTSFEAALAELGCPFTSRLDAAEALIHERAGFLLDGTLGVQATIQSVEPLMSWKDSADFVATAAEAFWQGCYLFCVEGVGPDKRALLALAADVVASYNGALHAADWPRLPSEADRTND